MTRKKKSTPKRLAPHRTSLIAELQTRFGLSDKQLPDLIRLLLHKTRPPAFDLAGLIPEGSALARFLRPYHDTDISLALPLFQAISIAASHLNQAGVHLVVPGGLRIRPTIWIIALADSGSAKTLATDHLLAMLGDGEAPPVKLLPWSGSDAQWICDLAENNGAFWYQDEVGQFFNSVLTSKLLLRLKSWILAAYSHAPIQNRLKSEQNKLAVPDPNFTFFGLSVRSTWSSDVGERNLLDGFCQRFCYVMSPARTDRDMFDYLLYFGDEASAETAADNRDIWQALCAQDGATTDYLLPDETLDYLKAWWAGLRHTWGDGVLPASFIRRIGYSMFRYLPVLHFLLGKARRPIDLETAELATRYAEFHFESALDMLQGYVSDAQRNAVQAVADARDRLAADDREVTPRTIQQRLSKAQRTGLDTDSIARITGVLETVRKGFPELKGLEGKALSAEVIALYRQTEQRLRLNERKRNERRLRELRRASKDGVGARTAGVDEASPVIPFPARDTDHFDGLLNDIFDFSCDPGAPAVLLNLDDFR